MTKAKDNPGPNTYTLPSTIGSDHHDPTRNRAPGFSMASRRTYSYQSGPGPYMVEGLTNKGKMSKDGFTLKGKHKSSMWSVNESPGPNFGAGQPSNYPASPRFSFGRPAKTSYRTVQPAPNAYNIPSMFGEGRKTTLNGRAKRSFAYDYAKTPGPVYNYNSNVTIGSGPAFSMGSRFKPTKPKTVTPGPNTYMPPMNGTVKNSPRFSMGVYHHEEVIPLAEVD